MRRMSKLASILDKSILADDEGNIETKKDVKIDGNLKFKSLVSNDNPDGIFDPSSGGTGGGGTGGGGGITTLYRHFVSLKSTTSEIQFNYYTISNTHLSTFDDLVQLVKRNNIQCIGFFKFESAGNYIVRYLKLSSESSKTIAAYSTKMSDFTSSGQIISKNSGYEITDTSTPVN